jgi:hypothetical protein
MALPAAANRASLTVEKIIGALSFVDLVVIGSRRLAWKPPKILADGGAIAASDCIASGDALTSMTLAIARRTVLLDEHATSNEALAVVLR